MDAGIVKIAASGIGTPDGTRIEDIARAGYDAALIGEADAALIGEALVTQPDPARTVPALLASASNISGALAGG